MQIILDLLSVAFLLSSSTDSDLAKNLERLDSCLLYKKVTHKQFCSLMLYHQEIKADLVTFPETIATLDINQLK